MTPRSEKFTSNATAQTTKVTQTQGGAGQDFYDLAKRLIAVPKEEVDQLRKDGDATTA
jgi:hypothetical protein